MEHSPLAAEYIDDPTLLLRPLAAVAARGQHDDRVLFLYRDGRSEQIRLDRRDVLAVGDLLREQVGADALEAIVVLGLTGSAASALVHFPTRLFYSSGTGTEVAPLFGTLLPLEAERDDLDHAAAALWLRRYPAP